VPIALVCRSSALIFPHAPMVLVVGRSAFGMVGDRARSTTLFGGPGYIAKSVAGTLS
jgi:hypothetical protein